MQLLSLPVPTKEGDPGRVQGRKGRVRVVVPVLVEEG